MTFKKIIKADENSNLRKEKLIDNLTHNLFERLEGAASHYSRLGLSREEILQALEEAVVHFKENEDMWFDLYDEYEVPRKIKSSYSLVGVDGNAFEIMGYVKSAMKKEGCTEQEIKEYISDATSGDYNHLLLVSQEMIENLNGEYGD